MIDIVQIVLGMAIGGVIGYVLQHVRPTLTDHQEQINELWDRMCELHPSAAKPFEED